MINKNFLPILGLMFLISCTPQNASKVSQTPIVRTIITSIPTFPSPVISKAETLQATNTTTTTPTPQKSATPFPDEKNMKFTTADGKWEISTFMGIASTIQITSADGKTKWVLDEITLPDVRLGQLWNYKTSNDGNSMFFGLGSYHYETLIGNRWPPGYGLYKLNLANGAVETILKSHTDASGEFTYGYFALAPTETQIVYSWWDEPSIFLRNFSTLDVYTIPLPDSYKISGPFVWSPDETSVIFTIWSNAWDYPTDFMLVRMDISDKSLHYLYSDNRPLAKVRF